MIDTESEHMINENPDQVPQSEHTCVIAILIKTNQL